MNAITPPGSSAWQRKVVACIPVCNEEERIVACLRSLADQDYREPFAVVLLLNNCTDGTAKLVQQFVMPPHIQLHVHQRVFPPHLAHAGVARHNAMRIARRLAGPNGVLLCTDADARVPADWIRRNLLAILQGADAVAGRAVMDEAEARMLPRQLHADEEAAQMLTRLLDEIDWHVDPDPSDPWPRHTEHSGASIAVTASAHDAVGGIPVIAGGEDRAFFAALRAVDAAIRHAPDIAVTVSGRLDGRAEGGMAETLRRRLLRSDEFLDDCIEPSEDHLRRAEMRRDLRLLRQRSPADVVAFATLLRLPIDSAALIARADSFGAAWALSEQLSPTLLRNRVRSRDVDREIAAALAILARLAVTEMDEVRPAARRSGNLAVVAS